MNMDEPAKNAGSQRGATSLLMNLLLACLAVVLSGCKSIPNELQRPNGVTLGSDGSLFVMDFGNYRIVHAKADGTWIRPFGRFGVKPNEIYYGWDLAHNSTGNLYIGNVVRDDEGTTHDGVKIFTPAGVFLQEIGAQDYDPSGEIISNKPYGLDIDNHDYIYVADYGPCTVRIFNTQGELLVSLLGFEAGGVEFTGLGDVAVDDTRDLFYVSDFDRHKVEQFKLIRNVGVPVSLSHVRTIGEYGRGDGQFAYPQNMTVDDSTGYLYVGDQANRRIQVFDSEGVYITSFSPPGVNDWQVMGLANDSQGHVYAADAVNNVVWVFSTDGSEPRRLEVKK